jgi:DNA polymerase I
MNRLLVIDGHAILHRAFHALPPLTTPQGKLVNAVYGFASILLKAVNDLHPTHIAVAFDRAAPTFRKKLYREYQATRPKIDEGLIPQIEIVHKLIEVLGIPNFEMDGFEADDVIGTITQITKNKEQRSKKEPMEIIIMTGDRDILQLVNDQVKVYMPVKGISESRLYDEKGVIERLGVKPSQIIDYKALVGDPSDNYPGVAGIGPKTAASLISQFGTLENLYKHLDEVKNPGLREKLETEIKSAELSKQLATIVTDVPVEFDLEKCKQKPFDTMEAQLFLDELGFRSLISRLSGKNSIPSTDGSLQKKTLNKNEEKDDNKQIALF